MIGRPQKRRGATAVEFAITAPVLFALCLGAIEFSRANMLAHTAAIAATEAARKSIIPGAVASDSRNAAMRELGIAGIKDATVELDPPVINDDVDEVTVNLTVPLGGRNGYTLARIFLGKELSKSVTLQREGKTVDVASEKSKGKKDGVKLDKEAEKAAKEAAKAADEAAKAAEKAAKEAAKAAAS